MIETEVSCPSCGSPRGTSPYCPKCGAKSFPPPEGDAVVREYASRAEFERDLIVMSAMGYGVGTVTELKQSAGCMRILTLGLIALVWSPKPHILVTYLRK